MTVNHVSGNKKGDVMLYALSTCGWCKKTRDLLEELKVDFNFTEVDLLDAPVRQKAIEEVTKWNPRCSFPSLVIDNSVCIVGFDEEKIREAFK